MKRRGRGFEHGADVREGDEADVSGEVPRAKPRARSRDALPGDAFGCTADGARVPDLAPGADITPEKHATLDAKDDDDDASDSASRAGFETEARVVTEQARARLFRETAREPTRRPDPFATREERRRAKPSAAANLTARFFFAASGDDDPRRAAFRRWRRLVADKTQHAAAVAAAKRSASRARRRPREIARDAEKTRGVSLSSIRFLARGDGRTFFSSSAAFFSYALGGFALGSRLTHSAAEASARAERRLARAEAARLRRRVDELELVARETCRAGDGEDGSRALAVDAATSESRRKKNPEVDRFDPDASSSDDNACIARESLEACVSARRADAARAADSESALARATAATRAATEDARRAELERAAAVDSMERSAAEARDALDALERHRTTTRLAFPPTTTFVDGGGGNATSRFRVERELRGAAPDFVASASLVALVAVAILAFACVALSARARRRLQSRVAAEARSARRASEAAAAAAAASRAEARKARLELDACEASKAAAVEATRRSAARDVENAAAMMARLTSLAEKAETSARAHRDENDALASRNAELKTLATSLEAKVRRAELAVAAHEAARERSRRRKREERERGDAGKLSARVAGNGVDVAGASAVDTARKGKETETSTSPAKLPAHRLAPFEPEPRREAAAAAAERMADEGAPSPSSPSPAPAPTPPRRASRSFVRRVMGWNARAVSAGANGVRADG